MGIGVIATISGVAGGELLIPTIVLLYPWSSFAVLRHNRRPGIVLGPVVGACWRDRH